MLGGPAVTHYRDGRKSLCTSWVHATCRTKRPSLLVVRTEWITGIRASQGCAMPKCTTTNSSLVGVLLLALGCGSGICASCPCAGPAFSSNVAMAAIKVQLGQSRPCITARNAATLARTRRANSRAPERAVRLGLTVWRGKLRTSGLKLPQGTKRSSRCRNSRPELVMARNDRSGAAT